MATFSGATFLFLRLFSRSDGTNTVPEGDNTNGMQADFEMCWLISSFLSVVEGKKKNNFEKVSLFFLNISSLYLLNQGSSIYKGITTKSMLLKQDA